MQTRHLIVVEPGRIELQELDLDAALQPHQALVEAEYSIVSAGTEGAGFTGLVREMPFGAGAKYPRDTGYGHLGRVLEVGSAVEMCRAGDRVLSFSRHASLVKADAARMALPVPKDAPGSHLVFARMAGVSISALRSSSVQPGDTVLVIGMGLVGNFAAQLFRMAGADVMAADLSDYRLDKARACGIERTVNPGAHDLQDAVLEWTAGEGVHVAVEAIGISEVVAQAVTATRRHGEVILLGSPRAPRHLRRDADAAAHPPGGDPDDRSAGVALAGAPRRTGARRGDQLPPPGRVDRRRPAAGRTAARSGALSRRLPSGLRGTHQPQGRLPGCGIRLGPVVRCR